MGYLLPHSITTIIEGIRMLKMYKDGKTALVEKEQVQFMTPAGWTFEEENNGDNGLSSNARPKITKTSKKSESGNAKKPDNTDEKSKKPELKKSESRDKKLPVGKHKPVQKKSMVKKPIAKKTIKK